MMIMFLYLLLLDVIKRRELRYVGLLYMVEVDRITVLNLFTFWLRLRERDIRSGSNALQP